ncbi:hypothetical protein Nmel_016475 [Mimus melanotis]
MGCPVLEAPLYPYGQKIECCRLLSLEVAFASDQTIFPLVPKDPFGKRLGNGQGSSFTCTMFL